MTKEFVKGFAEVAHDLNEVLCYDKKLTEQDIDDMINSYEETDAETDDHVSVSGSAQEAQHYKDCVMEPIEVMQSVLSYPEFLGFLKGNIIKYRMRAQHKGKEEDIGKSLQYSYWLELKLQGIQINPKTHVVPQNYTYRGI